MLQMLPISKMPIVEKLEVFTMSIPDNGPLIYFSFPQQLVIIFAPHGLKTEVENLGWTCLSDDLMTSDEMNDYYL